MLAISWNFFFIYFKLSAKNHFTDVVVCNKNDVEKKDEIIILTRANSLKSNLNSNKLKFNMKINKPQRILMALTPVIN